MSDHFLDVHGQVAEEILKRFAGITGSEARSSDLLERALEDVTFGDPARVLAGKANLVNLSWTLAMGSETVADQRAYGDRLDRFRNLLQQNAEVYQLIPRQGTVQNEHTGLRLFRKHGRPIILSFGELSGFTGVIPLTSEGMRAYATNRCSAKEFAGTPEFVVPGGNEPTGYLYISAVLDFAAIPTAISRKLGLSFNGRISGVSAITGMFRHLRRFLPAIGRDVETGYFTAGGCEEIFVASPISFDASGKTNGMGEPFLQFLEFQKWATLPYDISGHSKYVFDLGMINDDCIPDATKEMMIKAISTITDRSFPSPHNGAHMTVLKRYSP